MALPRLAHLTLPAIVLAFALIATPAGAAGTVKVSGTVKGGAGMTIAALASDGSATTRKLGSGGRFKLSLPAGKARRATLQLIGRSGAYFGPVVLRAAKGRAYSALAGRSAKLGTLALRRGYASPVRKLPVSVIDPKLSAKASKTGKPIGAGKLGVVRSSARARAAQGGSGGPAQGADTDADGIPNTVDGDDNGNLTLDGVDPASAASNAGLFSTLFLDFATALNANASGVSRAQIDALLAGENSFNMIFFFDEGRFQGRTITGAHVDCFALRYCRRGDGTAIFGGVSESTAPRGGRWVDFNTDGSGYPNLERISLNGGTPAWSAGIQPRVPTADIHPGDTYNVTFNSSAGPTVIPTVLSSYFITVPAVASYSSGGATTQVTYPINPQAPGSSSSNPIQMESNSLTLSFWRPQRAAIAGAETGELTDMGHLHYGVMPNVPGGGSEIGCRGHYSNTSATLGNAPASGQDNPADSFWPLLDQATDAAPDSNNTLSFTVDLAACLRAANLEPAGRTVELNLTAAGESRPGGADRAAQRFAVKLPG